MYRRIVQVLAISSLLCGNVNAAIEAEILANKAELLAFCGTENVRIVFIVHSTYS
jgi:hypothetical protein